ncbi:hypothetical protein PoB_000859600 [Plakobranchus ocellatus]|uniref:Uncharacterized protein n=1 Tax=Plakobranchus ocellatus TaxID=259542 RepID=A0AAV3YI85_9GAST|nr:hypothetical protein PoB_000859600 [Plakobranchus ocellatus]
MRSPLPSLVTSMASSPRIDFNSLWILKGYLTATFADPLHKEVMVVVLVKNMASLAFRHINSHLSKQPTKTLSLCCQFHQHLNCTGQSFMTCVKPLDHLVVISVLHWYSDNVKHRSFYQGKLSVYNIRQNEPCTPKNFLFARWLSIKKDTEQSFQDNDKTSIFDQDGLLIKETTFKQAKSLASSQKSRLVYMRTNPDGVPCFSLQTLAKKATKIHYTSGSAYRPEVSKSKKKDPKAPAKEYKVKASIAERDLNIKITQMVSHLSKGKQVIIFIKETSSQDQVSQGRSELTKRVKEKLGDVCKVNQDYSNATTTRLTLTPKETQIMQLNQDSES